MSFRINNLPIEELLMGTAIHKIVQFSKDIEIGFECFNIDKAFEKILGVTKDEICKRSLTTLPGNFDSGLVDFYKDFVINYNEVSTEICLNIFEKQVKVNLTKINREYLVTKIIDFKSYSQSIKNALKYETLFNSSMDIILTIRASGEIIDCNEQALKEFGYTREELLKLEINDLTKSTSPNVTTQQVHKAAKKGLVFEAVHFRKDGSTFTVEVKAVALEVEGEKIIFSIVRDITERKKLADDLNNKNNELESTLVQLKDTQIQLMNEDKMASIGQLSAGIAHEINNPLGFVLSNFNTLKRYIGKFSSTIESYRDLKIKLVKNYKELLNQELDELEQIDKKNKIDYILQDLEELFSDTEEGLNRIRKIVVALRNFAHENLNGELEEYDLNDGIKNTLIIVKNEIKYNCEIKTNLTSLPLINVIGSEINQVLLNMIINASHAIKEKIEKNQTEDEKHGEITISTFCENNYVCFSIEDNGTGISKDNLNKVFEPFFTTKPVGVGTGLGLSISYEIIKNKHKGEIEIDSTLGVGTKITIKLPQMLE